MLVRFSRIGKRNFIVEREAIFVRSTSPEILESLLLIFRNSTRYVVRVRTRFFLDKLVGLKQDLVIQI